jgi:peptide/nickel transport system substrate-binding protein
MKRLLIVLAMLALAASAAVAQDAEQPQSGGTLRAAWSGEWVSLDPHLSSAGSSFAVLANVIEALTDYDDEMQLAPELATSWEQSDDGLTWTFHLREGVRFSNAREFTADDVVYSFQRIHDPTVGSGDVSNCGGEGATFAAPDPLTFTVTTVAPNAILPVNVAGAASCAIIAEESVGEDGQIVTPIGTGPFAIESVTGTTDMRLVRNEHYWQDGLPYLDVVEITVIPEASSREAALLGGEVDWIMDPAPQSYDALTSNAEIVVGEAPLLSYHYIGLNLNREPFDDVRVRQAIAYAIDRDQICAAGAFGLCTPIHGPTAPGSAWYFDYAPYGRDLETARQLLADAGYEDGFEMEIMATSTYEESVRQAQVLQANLAEIGIRATISTPEFAEWLDREGNGDFDSFNLSWIALTDADDYFFAQHRTGEVFNFTGYSNPEFDALVDQGQTTSDFDERYAIYEQANRILVDDAPYVYFYSPLGLRAYRPSVKGFVTRPDLQNNLARVWLDE